MISIFFLSYLSVKQQRGGGSLLELLVLCEEHAEADDGSIDQEATSNGHDHGFDSDKFRVSEHNGEGYLKTG